MRVLRRSAPLLLLLAAACVSQPDLDGRVCSADATCPEPYACAEDGRCHLPCDDDLGCDEGALCMGGYCLVPSAPCSTQSDCGLGEACVAGTCTGATPPECASAADCVTPGPCQVGEGASCVDGQCAYPARACETPPASECVGADDLFRTFASVGRCDATTGACSYAPTELPCPSCNATCLTPCEGVTCPDQAGGCQTGGRCEPGAPGEVPTCAYADAPDGTACTLGSGATGRCASGRCAACTVDADCDDGNACTLNRCDAGTGECSSQPIVGACDDGNACTTGDTCVSGMCRGQSATTCTSPPGECFAAAGQCDPASGQCTYPFANQGTACGDDGVACTADVCDGSGSCTHPAAPVGTRCDDGDLCTYTDVCDAQGRCGGTPLVCSGGSGVCGPTRVCDGTPRCAESFPGGNVTCDDGQLCTYDDSCNGAGGCQGTGYSCGDGDICTSDACDGAGGCTYTPVAPGGLAPTGGATVTRQDVLLVWSPCGSASEYEVQIQYQAPDNSWRFYFTYNETVPNKTFFPCSSQAPAAPCNANFRFRVRARTAGAWGPYSAWATFFWANCRAC